MPSHDAVGINVGKDEILQNFYGRDDVAMNEGTPWRGPCEKARAFMQMVWRPSPHQEMSLWTAPQAQVCYGLT